jgi:hypothetical protein
VNDSGGIATVAALESVEHSGRGLRVEFFRLQERYAHRILAIGCEEVPVLLLESIEEIANKDYPSSPVLQALNIDDHGTNKEVHQPTAMLVGMSRKGHWSMSVQAGHADSAALTFDVACRIKEIPESLGSCYSWGRRVEVEDNDHVPRLHFGSGICLVELWESPWLCDRYHRALMFPAPGDDSCIKPPATLRWRYRVLLADS